MTTAEIQTEADEATTPHPFVAKNEARKKGREGTTWRERKHARELRRGVGGAFGKMSPEFRLDASVGCGAEGVDQFRVRALDDLDEKRKKADESKVKGSK